MILFENNENEITKLYDVIIYGLQKSFKDADGTRLLRMLIAIYIHYI